MNRNIIVAIAALIGCVLLIGSHSAQASMFEVGPTMHYKKLGAVPWSRLSPGDIVKIHWQAEPYREFVLISQSGTPLRHIVISGVPDPVSGKLPIIDGQDAVQSPSFHYHDEASGQPILFRLGVVMVSPAKGYRFGYVPSYIDIENLEIRNADENNKFTAWSGEQSAFHPFASSIYVEYAEHLAIRNCTLVGSGNGLFINSKFGAGGVSRDILIDGNRIHDNGVVGNASMHNCYTEAISTVYQNNYIGELRPGAPGSCLKDRSAGTIIRYNLIGGGGHCIDLVETQGGQGEIDLAPGYHETEVYGNIIMNGPRGATTMIHYGGDQYVYKYYRHGTLHFHDNTVVNQADQRGPRSRYSTMLFYLPMRAETGDLPVQEAVDCHDNVIYNVANTAGNSASDFYLLDTNTLAPISLDENWTTPGIHAGYAPYPDKFIGMVTGTSKLRSVPPDIHWIKQSVPSKLEDAGILAAKRDGVTVSNANPTASLQTPSAPHGSGAATLRPNDPSTLRDIQIKSVTLEMPSLKGGSHSRGRVTLTRQAPPKGVSVTFSCADPSVNVQKSVFLPAGYESVSFEIETLPVSESKAVVIMAHHDAQKVPAILALTK